MKIKLCILIISILVSCNDTNNIDPNSESKKSVNFVFTSNPQEEFDFDFDFSVKVYYPEEKTNFFENRLLLNTKAGTKDTLIILAKDLYKGCSYQLQLYVRKKSGTIKNEVLYSTGILEYNGSGSNIMIDYPKDTVNMKKEY